MRRGALGIGLALALGGCHQVAPTPNDVEVGLASFYADSLDGRPTASGEIYRSGGLTCAHPSLPFGAEVEVTLVATGRTVRVRVNDRGPYAGERIIDLSREAARRIGLIRRGVGQVQVRVIHLPR